MYFAELTWSLLRGVAEMTASRRNSMVDFFWRHQTPSGGFAGRSPSMSVSTGESASDLYYTSFALRGLTLLGAVEDTPQTRNVAEFLRREIRRHCVPETTLSIVDSLSLVFSTVLLEMGNGTDVFTECGVNRKTWIHHQLTKVRCRDGGLASTPNTPHSSTYHTFLGTGCLQMVGGDDTTETAMLTFPTQETPPDGSPPVTAAMMTDLVLSRQRADGGFVELSPLRHSGTNPTAAAVGLLRMLETMPSDTVFRQKVVEFLCNRQSSSGGFCANTRIPLPDLLSTFAAAVALRDVGAEEVLRNRSAAIRTYVQSLRSPDGGYFGAEWDNHPDVEYTFYGLAAESLLHPQHP